MPAAGDDLRGYLIVPPALSSSSSSGSHSNQPASSQLAPDPRPDDTPRFHKSAYRKAESTNMRVGYATHPGKVESVTGNDPIAVPMAGVMSLEDFLSANQEDHNAFLATRGEANARPSKKSKTQPSGPIQPVAVGARSSKHTILLHEQYQALAIPQPVFTYQGDGVTKFSVEVSFPGLSNAEELQGLKAEGRFNSKQEAKEAVCKSALAILERLVEEGRITKAGKAKKVQGQPKEEKAGENFVGRLLEFQNATGAPQPTYTDYQLGQRWACLAEIEGQANPYGSLEALFGSKKAARQHAASCAVAHFKTVGTWPDEFSNGGGIKKRKATPANPTPHSASPDRQTPDAASSTPGAASAQSQVASLAHMLGLSSPEYRPTYIDPSAPDMHTIACFFKDGGAHEGPIGEVRNIFGKKNARNECARKTLQYLTDLKNQREAIANSLIQGIDGAKGIEIVGVRMAMNSEERVAVKVDEGGSEDELDDFADAMEN